MPDIAMCVNRDCPRRNDCYRYRAEPTPGGQSCFSPSHDTCEHFQRIGGQRLAAVPMAELWEVGDE